MKGHSFIPYTDLIIATATVMPKEMLGIGVLTDVAFFGFNISQNESMLNLTLFRRHLAIVTALLIVS
jgi:hypothetical protein